MIIGVPREIKKDEYRVALLPVGAELLTNDGHTVLIEKEAGAGSGFSDRRYSTVGAQLDFCHFLKGAAASWNHW